NRRDELLCPDIRHSWLSSWRAEDVLGPDYQSFLRICAGVTLCDDCSVFVEVGAHTHSLFALGFCPHSHALDEPRVLQASCRKTNRRRALPARCRQQLGGGVSPVRGSWSRCMGKTERGLSMS